MSNQKSFLDQASQEDLLKAADGMGIELQELRELIENPMSARANYPGYSAEITQLASDDNCPVFRIKLSFFWGLITITATAQVCPGPDWKVKFTLEVRIAGVLVLNPIIDLGPHNPEFCLKAGESPLFAEICVGARHRNGVVTAYIRGKACAPLFGCEEFFEWLG